MAFVFPKMMATGQSTGALDIKFNNLIRASPRFNPPFKSPLTSSSHDFEVVG